MVRERESQEWALRRYLFGSLAVASLMLCLTTVVLWLRSYRLLDELSRVKVGTEAPTSVGNHATVYVRESVIGTTSGKVYWSVETSRRTYRPDDPSDDAILQDWKAREGVHIHYWAQPAVLLENQYPSPGIHSFFGFFYHTDGDAPFRWPPTADSDRVIAAPIWAVFVTSLMLSIWGALSYLRVRRATGEGCCETCGYDLNGNASGTCPECGSPLARPPRAG